MDNLSFCAMNALKGIDWIETDGKFKCLICKGEIKFRSNLYEHIKKCKHKLLSETKKGGGAIDKFIKNGSGRKTEITGDEFRDVMIWSFTHDVSLNAIHDKRFKYNSRVKIGCQKTIWKKITELNNRYKNALAKKLKANYVSIMLDGSHINSFGFYAICGYSFDPDTYIQKIFVLDIHEIESATSQNISEKIKETMEFYKKVTFVAACTDNARNLVSIFNRTITSQKELDDIIRKFEKKEEKAIKREQRKYIRICNKLLESENEDDVHSQKCEEEEEEEELEEEEEEEEEEEKEEEEDEEDQIEKNGKKKALIDLPGVSCAVHTGQLIVFDVRKKSNDFNSVYLSISKIPSLLNKRRKFSKKCPLYQPQRWNSCFMILKFIKENQNEFDKFIQDEFKNTQIEKDSHDFDLLFNVLLPLYNFTNNLEGNEICISEVYFQVIALKKLWNNLPENCSFKKHLIESLEYRFKVTYDLRVAHLASLLTPQGTDMFVEEFPQISPNQRKEPGMAEKVRARDIIIAELSDCCQKLCDIWGIYNCFNVILDLVKNANTRRIQEKRNKIYTKNDLLIIAKELMWCEGLYSDVKDFVARFASIPASEAACERVFASMRDIISPHKKRYTPLHLRDAAILKITHGSFDF